jgi:hypothetical protein
MPKRSSKATGPKKSKDTQQLARSVLDAVVPDAAPPKKVAKAKDKNPAAVALGKLGGAKGGPARAAALTPAKRAEIAANAAKARWSKKSG